MNYLSYIPVYEKLTGSQMTALYNASFKKSFSKGEILHNGSYECTGLILVVSGQLRAFTVSNDGRELTLYRLFERDICLFSASCIMNSLQFDITLSAEKDTEVIIIPGEAYKKIMEESILLSNYTNEVMASRFSDVMWLVDQLMWKSFDVRLAEFLLNESQIENSLTLKLTHEQIGNHLGNPREVVSRMLKYFEENGLVSLSRGTINIINIKRLEDLIK